MKSPVCGSIQAIFVYMADLSLNFDATGFTYDVDNPTLQTEKLSFILSEWLLSVGSMSPVPLVAVVSEEGLSETQQFLIDSIDGFSSSLGLQLTDVINNLSAIENQSGKALDHVGALVTTIEQIEDYERPDFEGMRKTALSSVSALLQDIAAACGVTLDAPGTVITRNNEVYGGE